mgnify:FL=1
MIYRPTRERDIETLKESARIMLQKTGHEEISLSSLSSSDYSHLKEIVNISGKDEKTLAARLEEHRREVHDRIAKEHPELAERFRERRHHLDQHLKERRPEVYELVISLREKERK